MASITERVFWQEIAELSEPPPWHSRFDKMIRFIRPSDRVIDFGCGNQYLRSLLPPGAAYQPIDCVPSEKSNVFICDYNAEIRFPKFDPTVLFFSGFFEYILQVDKFMERIVVRYPGTFCIFSYAWSPRENRSQNHWVSNIGDQKSVMSFFGKYMVGLKHVDDWSDHTHQMICTGEIAGKRASARHLMPILSWDRRPAWNP